MRVLPITLRDANAFVGVMHRHHGAAQGCKFALSANDDGKRVGVCIVGRPVSRILDDGSTAEVTRLCTDGTYNACSFLYGAAARVAKEMGYARIITYVLESEPGTSLRASGWTLEKVVPGQSWSTPRRRRVDKHPVCAKQRWVKHLAHPRTDS